VRGMKRFNFEFCFIFTCLQSREVIGGSSPAGAGNLSLHHHVQTGSGIHTASYLMGTRGSFSGGKAAGA
jgi:hypothetical protein